MELDVDAEGDLVYNCLGDLYQQLGVQLVANWIGLTIFFHVLPRALTSLSHLFLSRGTVDGESSRARYVRARASVEAGAAAVRAGAANVCSPDDLWLRVSVEAEPSTFDPNPLYMIHMLQAGYVMLFSPAFPLAPTLAVGTNVLSSLLDSDLALRRSTRPLPEGAQDMGAWSLIFEFLALMAVITNCVVIAIPTTRPIFDMEDVGTTLGPRLVWFVVVETALFGYKYMLANYLPRSSVPTAALLLRQEYLVKKHILGAADAPDEPPPSVAALERERHGHTDAAASSAKVAPAAEP